MQRLFAILAGAVLGFALLPNVGWSHYWFQKAITNATAVVARGASSPASAPVLSAPSAPQFYCRSPDGLTTFGGPYTTLALAQAGCTLPSPAATDAPQRVIFEVTTQTETVSTTTPITTTTPRVNVYGNTTLKVSDAHAQMLMISGSRGAPASGGGGGDSSTFWTGILPTDRGAPWENVGAQRAAIPTYTSVQATLSAGATASQINSALASCSGGEVVELGVGTFNITDYIDNGNSGCVIRGSGYGTVLNMDSDENIFIGAFGASNTGGSTPDDSGWTDRAWTGGLTQGSTQLTIASTTGLAAGDLVILSELNREWVFVGGNAGGISDSCVDTGSETGGNSHFYGAQDRVQCQITLVESVDSGTQITIRDPVSYTHVSGSSPVVSYWDNQWVHGSGIENLRIDANGGEGTIALIHCVECWARNVWIDDFGRGGFLTRWSYGATLIDSLLQTTTHTQMSTEYGVECWSCSNLLVENNIFIGVTSPFVPSGQSNNSVFAYNYATKSAGSELYPTFSTHWPHSDFILFEGNDAPKFQMDNVWGSSSHVVYFRNRMRGTDTGKTGGRYAIMIQAHNRYASVVNNVLGDNSFHSTGLCTNLSNPGGNPVAGVGFYGGSGQECGDSNTMYDAVTRTSTIWWKNYDLGTDATGTFDQTASGESLFPGLSSPATTFPASFYLEANPTDWFEDAAWPPIGSDVTCSSNCVANAGSKANKIPARLRYEASTVNGSGYVTSLSSSYIQ